MARLPWIVGMAFSSLALAQGPAPRQFLISTKVGASYQYRFKMIMRMDDGQSEAVMEADVSQRLLGSRGSLLDWKESWDITKSTGNGAFEKVGPILAKLDGTVIMRTTDPFHNTLKSSSGDKVLKNSQGPTLSFPKRPIAVGESWSKPVELNGQTASMTFRFEGLGNYGDRPAAKFTGTFQGHPIVASMEPHTFYVDLADGMLLHCRGISRITKGNKSMDVWFEEVRKSR